MAFLRCGAEGAVIVVLSNLLAALLPVVPRLKPVIGIARNHGVGGIARVVINIEVACQAESFAHLLGALQHIRLAIKIRAVDTSAFVVVLVPYACINTVSGWIGLLAAGFISMEFFTISACRRHRGRHGAI